MREILANSESEEDQNRLANIEELLTAAREFDTQNPGESHLEAFLEQVCLVNETDDWEAETDKVTLMTIHAAKGLEFPVVFIIATEEGLMPHERSQNDLSELEEERRLLFVGITRAAVQLQLSYAIYREFRGQRRRTVPSSFLMELPRHEMELVESRASTPFSTADWEVTDYEQSDYEQSENADKKVGSLVQETTPEPLMTTALTTAAEMAGDAVDDRAAAATDLFVQGMAVTHPQHGLGKIVALSGDGLRRKATVAFVTAGEKKFVLAKSPLRPARRR
jgi:DNA helicase-2/ATP-dependent DNA helicase PcrA